MTKIVYTPLTDETVKGLKAGDRVLLNGVIYTGRDAAHKRLVEMMERGEKLPLELEGQIIYYVGPCPAKPGKVIGSAGPTTSGRMDAYAPRLMEKGLKGMIGKGIRNDKVVEFNNKKQRSILCSNRGSRSASCRVDYKGEGFGV